MDRQKREIGKTRMQDRDSLYTGEQLVQFFFFFFAFREITATLLRRAFDSVDSNSSRVQSTLGVQGWKEKFVSVAVVDKSY